MEACFPKNVVLLTGFGAFSGHDVNASWVAVEELAKTGVSDHVELHAMKVPVDYKYVTEKLPAIELELNPDLIIHVGVSGVTSVVQVEEFAHNKGYHKTDIHGYCPPESEEEQERLTTTIDTRELRNYCENHDCFCTIESSQDAGRYLCEFIYYKSLRCEVAPALFVHVPCLNAPYCKEKLASTLKYIILGTLKQIHERH
eukprot:gene9670-10656_t